MTERGELVLMVTKLQAENAQLWRDLKAADQKTDKLRAVADAARKLGCHEYDCDLMQSEQYRALDAALAALDATEAPRCEHGVHGTDCVECFHRP